MELDLINGLILIVLGTLAGAINTVAGGGSNLTLPSLMIMGMPPEIANASNRVGIFIQSLVGIRGFNQHGRLDTTDIGPILVPTLLGGLSGALVASYAPSELLKALLLGTMLGMALLMLIRPSVVVPEAGTVVKRVKQTPAAWWGLFVAGLYGGFVQAGVGFVLLAALAGTLRYDLVRANALKLICTLGFTLVALVVFISRDQVDWIPALVLSVGFIFGAQLGVKFAIKAKAQTLKWFIFAMTLVAVVAAYVF
ncbi:MAG: sulfite exporter TauE/SafE family protein [Pseudomonadota bacterium]